jgi:hypothetical protein
MVKTDVDDNGDRRNFGYSKPAVYQIKVLGIVPPDWSDRLGGMQISTTHKHEKKQYQYLQEELTTRQLYLVYLTPYTKCAWWFYHWKF